MRRAALLLGACTLALAGCAVPHERSDLTLEKSSARTSEVTAVFARYRAVRNTAIALLDPKPLSTVESGSVLAIDSGSFEVAQRLARKPKVDPSAAEVTDIRTPRFRKYPLWFFAVVRDRGLGINKAQIFERTSAIDPWLLTASPETLADTALPEVRRRSDKSVLTVKRDDKVGMAMSPQQAADTYARSLADPSSPAATRVADDSFIKQMRAATKSNARLEGVKFSQTWAANKVRYALRTTDGGALAFATLLRLDTYEVKNGLTVSWPKGSPQQAFLSSGISSSGKLRYYHQVLLYLPGDGGKPRALGQYGGVVSADAA